MLAYVFWHRPLDGVDTEVYERAEVGFHESLRHVPPAGFRGSAVFRVAELPWLPTTSFTTEAGAGGYEDWFLLEDYTAMGVLNEAAGNAVVGVASSNVTYQIAAKPGGIVSVYDQSANPPALKYSGPGPVTLDPTDINAPITENVSRWLMPICIAWPAPIDSPAMARLSRSVRVR